MQEMILVAKKIKKNTKQKQVKDEQSLVVAKENLTRQGWVIYGNAENDIWNSVHQGPVVKIEKGKSYFIFPKVEGSENDAGAIQRYCELKDIEQPTITLEDEEYDLNGFRIDGNIVVVIHEDGTVELTFAEFAEAVTTIPNLNG